MTIIVIWPCLLQDTPGDGQNQPIFTLLSVSQKLSSD